MPRNESRRRRIRRNRGLADTRVTSSSPAVPSRPPTTPNTNTSSTNKKA